MRFSYLLFQLFNKDRVDFREFIEANNLDIPLVGVDRANNPTPTNDRVLAVAEPVTPYERLMSLKDVEVSRDFRDLALWDRTKKYPGKIYGWPTNKSRGQSRGTLKWEDITTIVVHTAGTRGLHPDRWLGVPSHVAVADDASVVLQHYLNTYLWASHAANRYSMSLEIAGNRTITPEQIPAARAAVQYMYEERQRHHAGPMCIAPHAFSHRSRVNDCDKLIWDEVCVWAIEKFSLKLGPVVGSGRKPKWIE